MVMVSMLLLALFLFKLTNQILVKPSTLKHISGKLCSIYMVKRLFDISLAIMAFVPATIAIAVAAIWIKLDSSGPVLFKQIRVGRHQKPFTMLKLRTMDVNTGDQASHETSSSQITKVGKILRKTKIDELPQIWLVLVGDMSFVGPRPCLPTQTDLIKARDRSNAFSVLPGITGPAQIAKVDMSTPERLAEIDGEYASSVSIAIDISYVWATLAGRGSGDAVR